METTKNELTEYEQQFFFNLKNYIDKPIYFYGSIQRGDYFPQSSDIDVDIFTDNVNSTLHLLQNYLRILKTDCKNTIYKMNETNQIIPGYKIKYEDEIHNLHVEFSLYNEKYKKEILEEHNSKNNLPSYLITILIFLKLLYYKFGMLTEKYYDIIKKFVCNYCYDNNTAEFVKLDL